VCVHLAVVDVVGHGSPQTGRSGRCETRETGGSGGSSGGGFVQRSDHVLKSKAALLLLGFGRQFAIACLDAFLLHGQRPIHLFESNEFVRQNLKVLSDLCSALRDRDSLAWCQPPYLNDERNERHVGQFTGRKN